jgi:hypothetical protein
MTPQSADLGLVSRRYHQGGLTRLAYSTVCRFSLCGDCDGTIYRQHLCLCLCHEGSESRHLAQGQRHNVNEDWE